MNTLVPPNWLLQMTPTQLMYIQVNIVQYSKLAFDTNSPKTVILKTKPDIVYMGKKQNYLGLNTDQNEVCQFRFGVTDIRNWIGCISEI